jgi:hypothetical protein
MTNEQLVCWKLMAGMLRTVLPTFDQLLEDHGGQKHHEIVLAINNILDLEETVSPTRLQYVVN